MRLNNSKVYLVYTSASMTSCDQLRGIFYEYKVAKKHADSYSLKLNQQVWVIEHGVCTL